MRTLLILAVMFSGPAMLVVAGIVTYVQDSRR